jgi:hypothetical protein
MRASGNKSTLCVTAFVAAANWHFEGAPQTLHSLVDSQRFLSDTTPLPKPLNPPFAYDKNAISRPRFELNNG